MLASCLGASVDLDVVKRRVKNRRFLAIWGSCLGGSVDLETAPRRGRNCATDATCLLLPNDDFHGFCFVSDQCLGASVDLEPRFLALFLVAITIKI